MLIFSIYLIFCIFIAVLDIKYRVIPNRITFLGQGVGLLLNLSILGILGLLDGILGAIVGLFCLMFSGFLNLTLYKRPSLGGGDVQLMGLIGAFWGWKVAVITYALAPFLCVLWAIKTLQTRVAYGAIIIVASFIALLITK